MSESSTPSGRPLADLIEGARTFRQREYVGEGALMPKLAAGQKPQVLVIGCSDSRVDPAHICNARPGDLFIVRNVANLAPPPGSDALGHGVMPAVEYGVKALGVAHIVVLGHARCGGMAAALATARGEAPTGFEFVGPWLETALTACREVLAAAASPRTPDDVSEAEITALVEQRSVKNSLDNLRSYPWIDERIKSGQLALHGWWFDLDSGQLWTADPETAVFSPVEEHTPVSGHRPDDTQVPGTRIPVVLPEHPSGSYLSLDDRVEWKPGVTLAEYVSAKSYLGGQ